MSERIRSLERIGTAVQSRIGKGPWLGRKYRDAMLRDLEKSVRFEIEHCRSIEQAAEASAAPRPTPTARDGLREWLGDRARFYRDIAERG